MRNKNSSEHPRKVKIRGIEQKVCMAKMRYFAEIAPNLPFTEYDFYEEYRGAFDKSELGRMKKILPLHEMAKSLGLVSKRMAPKRGRRSYFTPEGKVALMCEASLFSERENQTIAVITTVYRQQHNHFRSSDAADQGEDEDDGNPVHLLRDSYGECR